MAYMQLNFPDFAQQLQAAQQQTAMTQMQNQAQGAAMHQQATTPPEDITEPNLQNPSAPPANPALNQVPL